MYGLITSFYITTGVSIVVVVILIAILLIKNKRYGNTQQLMMLSFFVVCFLLIIAIYYVTTYMGENTDVWKRGTFGRCFEYTLCILLEYSWFRFVRANLQETGCKRKKLDMTADLLLGGFLALSLFCCVFYMNDSYFVEPGDGRTTTLLINAGLMLSICSLNFVYLFMSIRSEIGKLTKYYIILILVILTVNEITQDIMTGRLVTGRIPYSAESFYFDPAYGLMIITALLTLVYVFRQDFTPAYIEKTIDEEKLNMEDKEVLLLIMDEKGLTDREKDIIQYIYDGYSYESVGKQLYISKYTVKNHVHNAYLKLGINSRNDFNLMIREYKKELLSR